MTQAIVLSLGMRLSSSPNLGNYFSRSDFFSLLCRNCLEIAIFILLFFILCVVKKAAHKVQFDASSNETIFAFFLFLYWA